MINIFKCPLTVILKHKHMFSDKNENEIETKKSNSTFQMELSP